MNPEDMMLSEISQTQKDQCCLTPLTGGPRGVRFIETGSRWWGQGLGRGRAGLSVSRGQSVRWKDGKSWRQWPEGNRP